MACRENPLFNVTAISEDGREFEVRSPQDYGHDTAVNPVIVWLMIGSFFCLILKNRKKHWTEMKNQYFINSIFFHNYSSFLNYSLKISFPFSNL